MTKEELEKEAEKYFKSICEDYNEEYERTGKRHYWVGFDIKNAYLASAEPREKRIAELEKENAELKAQLENEKDLPAIAYQQGAENYKRKSDKQLTKAKEIIKGLLSFVDSLGNYSGGIFAKAEQFLNDLEK